MWYKKSNFGGGIISGKSGGTTPSAPPTTLVQSPQNPEVSQLKKQFADLQAKVDNNIFYDIEGVYADPNDLKGVRGMTQMLKDPQIDTSQMTMEELLTPARQPDNVVAPTEINNIESDQYMRSSIKNNVPAPGTGWQQNRIPNPYHPMNTPYQK